MRRITIIKAALGSSFCAALCALPGAAQAQVSSINSAILMPRVFNDMPGGTGTYLNAYPASITLGEAGISRVASGGLDRDVWYFSNNGGAAPYSFQNNDYFKASFTVNMTGGVAGTDLEAGFIFSNPTGSFGGDDQLIVQNTGGVVQFGGPSFFAFSPQDGGTSVPNYVEGTPLTMGFNYLIDPNTSLPAFQYSVNGVFATSSPGDTFFDLGGPIAGSPASTLGGYLQLGNPPTGANNGQAIFSNISITPVAVPEPASLSMLAIGGIALVGRRRAKRSV
jgi:PEP-CTERM motif